jgi:energy-coupling factor transporter ATP-binding protein EcfA2
VPEDGDLLDRIVEMFLAVDPEVDALSIAETVWLAARSAPEPAARAPDAERSHVSRDTIVPIVPAEPRHLETLSPPATAPAPVTGPRRDRNLYQAIHAVTEPARRGQSVRAPRGHALPRSLDLGRSMRPLKRRWRAGRRQELDLAATVDGYARTLELLPVLRPAPERWFELFLIVDRSPSMRVWQQTITELAELLRNTGAFRKLQVWDLHPETNEVILRGPRGQRLVPEQLSAASGRRLAVVISDCSADGWRAGGAWTMLREWSEVVTTALVNPLPPKLWRHTGLDLPAVRVGPSGVPGAPSTALSHDVPLALHPTDETGTTWVPVPVLALTPYSVGRWARTVMRVDSRGCDAILIPDPKLFVELSKLERDHANGASAAGPDSGRIVSSFLHLASPSAVQLAVLCTQFSQVDLALLDIIRAELVPAAEVADAAEVVMSGLFTVEQAGTVLRFRGDTRKILRSRLSAHDAGRLIDVLSEYVATHAGAVPSIRALIEGPQGHVLLPPASEAFARVTGKTIGLMGSALTWKPVDHSAAITAILAARERHVPTVERLGTRLSELGKALADVGGLLQEIENGARTRPTSWARLVQELAVAVAAEQAANGRLLERLRRPTLNIAVIGPSGQGKSRFLQSLTGLTAQVIPDERAGPGTGAPALIRHRPGSRTYADVFFYSPASFLAEVVGPYYRRLGLGPPPASLRDFESAGNDLARAFKKYEALIGAPSPRRIDADQIRGFVARQDAAGQPQYAYHAVRGIHVTTTFPHADLAGLGFIDLPGLEDADLVDTRTRTALRHDTDLTLFVRRPDPDGDALRDADVELHSFAESVLPPIPMERQSFLMLNLEGSGNLAQAERFRAQAAGSGLRVARIPVADFSSAQETADAFAPILDYLAANLAELDQLLVDGARGRADDMARQAGEMASEMAALRTGDRWSAALRALAPGGTTPIVSPAAPAAPAALGIRSTAELPPPLGGGGAAPTTIGLWGAPGSGKATYVAALQHALLQTDASVGRWALYPRTETSMEALIKWTHRLVNEGLFPEAHDGGDPTELVWRLVGDLTGSQYTRRRIWRPRPPAESEFELDLIDADGEFFSYSPAGRPVPPGWVDIALRHLTRAKGLIFLFDPVTEREQRIAAGYMNSILLRLSRRIMDEGRLVGPYLPHYIAVCITKFDHKDVFRQAREAGLVNYGPDGMPRVLDEQAEKLFDTICEGTFWPPLLTDTPGGALFVRDQLRRFFHPDRIRYYVTSSVGYRKPPGWDPGAAMRPGFEFDPEDFANVAQDGNRERILGPIRPVNVLEPLVDLQMRIAGRV